MKASSRWCRMYRNRTRAVVFVAVCAQCVVSSDALRVLTHRSHRRRYRKLLGTSEPQSCSPPRSPPNSNPSLKVPKTSRKLRCPQVISEGHGGSKSRKLTDLAGKRHLFYPCGKLPTAEIPTRSFPTRRRRRPRSPDPAQLSTAGTARIGYRRTLRSQRCCCAHCALWHCGSR